MNVESIFTQAIAYLLYCSSLSGTLQVFINQLKPSFIEPYRKEGQFLADPNRYLAFIYVLRTVLTIVAYLTLWGGVGATRALLGSLPLVIPDLGVGTVTVMLIVMGQEILHPLITRLYEVRDATKVLQNPPAPEQPVPAAVDTLG